ncbi:MAG: phosphoribosylaminoimidazolesuccinocarboxamide synthase [Oligoflexia bacterium]|nr:phosphoribosylaminoimidazolesuccinocarboxamide synthase [Oligoflexia bacterium]
MKKKDLLYEGKAKKVYLTDKEEFLVTEFKNSLTAFNAKKLGSFENKGVINLSITTTIFKYLEKNGIKTHFVENISNNEMVVRRLKMIPLEVVVRNIAAGSFSSRFNIPEGEAFEKPFVEFYYKNDALNDPLLTDEHVLTLKIANQNEINELKLKALKINQALITMFDKADIKLVDFKIEFGKLGSGEIVLGDEISPDSCRLWDKKTDEKLDKDRFRRDLGRVQESYEEVVTRIQKHWGK